MRTQTFFTSDPHYWHSKVIDFCKRPFSSVEEMNRVLIENWNITVHPRDEVYVLGDFAFCGAKKIYEIMAQLHGTKYLIMGNHDWKYKRKKWIKFGFQSVFNVASVYGPNGLPITMSHFPFKNATDVDDRYLEHRVEDDGKMLLLHGHVHCTYKKVGRMINVGVDVWDYAPVSLDEILALGTGGPAEGRGPSEESSKAPQDVP